MTKTMSRYTLIPVASLIAGACLIPTTAPAEAAPAIRAFKPRFSADARGALTIVSNTLMTCDSIAPALNADQCAAAQADRSLNESTTLINNNFSMINVDSDSDPATVNSSSARLVIPSGARVLFAGLYWMGTPKPGDTDAQMRQLKLKAPGDSGYRTITADGFDAPPSSGWAYQSFKNVTKLVRARGTGIWTIANAVTGPNPAGDVGAGWSLVVAYSRSSDPLRRLTVLDGQQIVGPSGDLSIGVSGFRAVRSGSTGVQIGFVAFDGDRGEYSPGDDSASLNGLPLSDAIHASDNFFNSSIGLLGAVPAGMSPNFGNQLGYDASIVAAPDGALGNGATSATLAAAATGENLQAAAATFSAKLDATSKIRVSVKVPRYVVKGRVVHATVTVRGSSSASASNVRVCGNLPEILGYVEANGSITHGKWGCWRLPTLGAGKSHSWTVRLMGVHTGWGSTRVTATSAWTGSAAASTLTAVTTSDGFTG